MRKRCVIIAVCGAFIVFTATGPEARAQQIRYMDSSGNIHFVDSLSEVPPRYREQIVPPTPTPVLDKRGQMAKKRAEVQAARERELEERRRRVEEQRRMREKEMAALKERRRLERERKQSSFDRE